MIYTKSQLAVLAMCAIVITIYALRNSEAHYLPDFLGLALALSAPNQTYGIAAVLVVAAIRHTALGYGLAGWCPDWLLIIVLPAAHHMSISSAESSALEYAYKKRILESETNEESEEIPRPVAENSKELITLGETIALARLVAVEKIGLTDAVKIGAGAKSGAKYQRRSKEIKAAVAELQNHYPKGTNLTKYQ